MLTSALPKPTCIAPSPFPRTVSPGPESTGPIGLAMSFGRNAEIYAEGETAGYVYKVLSGLVRVSKLLPEVGGRSARSICRARCSASRPTRSITLRPSPWSPSGSWPSNGKECSDREAAASFVRELLTLALLGLSHTQDHLLLLGRKNALERLAAFLLEMGARMAGAPSSIWPCRGTTSPTISG